MKNFLLHTLLSGIFFFNMNFVPGILAIPISTGVTTSQIAIDEVDALIQRGIELGIKYLNTDDKSFRKQSKKNFDEARKILEKRVKKDENCALCMEKLVEVRFYKAYFKHDKNYKDCIKLADKGLERFPESKSLTFYKGYAHYNSENYAEANKALNYFLILSSGDPDAEAEVQNILENSYSQFLNNWNEHEEFYNSPSSRIDIYNQQTYQFQRLFQVTPQWEMQTGNSAHQQLAGSAPLANDTELQLYLEDLVNKLVSRTPGPFTNYKVTILNSPAINAVTPPGHIIVYTGLIQFAENEAQLAGVLSHELAHNFAHHSATRYIKAYHAQNLTNTILNAIDPQKQLVKSLSQLASQIGLDLYLKAHSRSDEKEADLYGAHIMFNAGYHPTALSEFFLKLYEYNPKQPAKFLSTHPPSPDRALYLTDYLESFPLDREMRLDSEAFQAIKARYGSFQVQNKKGKGILPPTIKN